MSVEIDGYAVLGAIARSPHVFQASKVDVVKAAKNFVVKQIKHKSLDLDGLKAILQAIQVEAFELIVDGLSDADLKSILAKVDKQNDAVKTAPVPEQRRLVSELARGAVTPALKATPAPKLSPSAKPKAAKPPPPAVERSGSSKAMKAKRKA